MAPFPRSRAWHRALVVSASLLVGLVPACGAGGTSPTGFDPEHPPTTPPMVTLASEGGTWTIGMWVFPEPARRGPVDVLFAISDQAGAPVDGLSVQTQPWMPAHGHGAATSPVVAGLGEGRYWAMPINFYMPGRWELRTTLAGDVTERVVFVVDVP